MYMHFLQGDSNLINELSELDKAIDELKMKLETEK